MKKNLVKAFAICSIASMVLSGCSGCKKEEPKETETQEALPVETQTQQVEETREGMLKSFYTGLWIDEKVAMQRPVAIMTENTSACLPQYGLNQADIVYECPVEGGLTRLMGIYQNYANMDKIGNVRSCRHYYCYFASEFDAFYIHAGKSPKGEKLLKSGYIDHIDGSASGGKYFYRDSSEHKAPHNLYISSKLIDEAFEDNGFEKTLKDGYVSHYQFAKEDEPVMLTDGIDAQAISLYFFDNKPYYTFNSEDGMYYRYEYGKEQMDARDNTQLTAKNIIIQLCESKVLDKYGRLNVKTKGEGEGYYITNGKAQKITWKKDSVDEGYTHYYDETGNEIIINPGRTWVEICQQEHADKNKFYATVEEFNKK